MDRCDETDYRCPAGSLLLLCARKIIFPKHIIFIASVIFFFFGGGDVTMITLEGSTIQTKFSHMTFDWNSSAVYEDGYRRSHVTPIIGGFYTPLKINTSDFNQS